MPKSIALCRCSLFETNNKPKLPKSKSHARVIYNKNEKNTANKLVHYLDTIIIGNKLK